MISHAVRESFGGILIFFAWMLYPNDAQAYIDPGSGSFIIQCLIAAVLGMLFSLKVFWGKIKAYFRTTFTMKRNNKQ